MIPNLPIFISIVFALTTLLTLLLLYLAIAGSKTHAKYALPVSLGLLLWMGIQSGIAFSGFLLEGLMDLPPRFPILVLPPLILILYLFTSKKGKAFVDSLPQARLTYIHSVRIPVEIVLYWLFLNAAVPELMTFAGRNFDILAGITAPIVAYVGIQKGLFGRGALLAWNFICLGLVMFIVANAILATPTPVQQFGFDQPNVAIFYFPFVWLPGVVVPIVWFAHFASIRALLRKGN